MCGKTISRLEREVHVRSSRENSSTSDHDREMLSNAEVLSNRRRITPGRSGSGPQLLAGTSRELLNLRNSLKKVNLVDEM